MRRRSAFGERGGNRLVMKQNRIQEKGARAISFTAYFLTVFLIVASFVPMIWMISSSLKDVQSIYSFPPKWIPPAPQSITLLIDYSESGQRDQAFYELEAAKATWFTWKKFQNLSIGEMKVIGLKDGRKLFSSATPAYIFTAGRAAIVPANVFTDEVMKLKIPVMKDRAYWQFDWYDEGVPLTGKEQAIVREGADAGGWKPMVAQIGGYLKQDAVYLNGSLLAASQSSNWARVFDNYAALWRLGGQENGINFMRAFGNSVFVNVVTILLHVSIGGMAGYALSRLVSARWSVWLTLFFVATIMIPEIVILVPLYLTMEKLSLVNTLWGIILPHSAWGIVIYLFRGFFDQLPGELLQAARIDGASELRIYTRFVVPMSMPIFTVVGVMSFISVWNEFLWPLIVARQEAYWTITVALYAFQSGSLPQNLLMASSVVATIPLLLVFLFCQKLIERGVAWTGVKG